MISVFSALIGVFGGIFGTWCFFRYKAAMELLSEALHIQALEEAYIVDGQGYEKVVLSENRQLPQKDGPETPHLLKVEVRAVLDENDWNSPPEQRYRFLDGRRTWIVRNELVKKPVKGQDPHPALLSSRACEELEGWIERVASAYSTKLLSRRRLSILRPLLAPVSIKNKRDIFELRGNLTPAALKFLEWYEKWDRDNRNVCPLEKYPSKKERLIQAWRVAPCSKLVSTIRSVWKS